LSGKAGGRSSWWSWNPRQVRIRRGPAYDERVTSVRVKSRVETLASGSLAHRREGRTRHGALTRVARPFGAPSIGFPDQTLLETIAGQRTSVGAEKPLANRSGRLSSILFPSTAGPTTGCNFFFLQTWRKIYVQTFPSTAGP
jgi:hypothetical protein